MVGGPTHMEGRPTHLQVLKRVCKPRLGGRPGEPPPTLKHIYIGAFWSSFTSTKFDQGSSHRCR